MAKKEVITPAGFIGFRNPPVTRHQSRGYRVRLGASGSPPDDGPDGQRYSRADPQLFGTHQKRFWKPPARRSAMSSAPPAG